MTEINIPTCNTYRTSALFCTHAWIVLREGMSYTFGKGTSARYKIYKCAYCGIIREGDLWPQEG